MNNLPTPMGEKTEEMKDAIESLFPGTKNAIANDACPVCHAPITKFRDELSKKEFGISGMCQACQDKVFG